MWRWHKRSGWALEGINSRLHEAEDQINDWGEKVEKNTQAEQQKEKIIFKNEESLRNILDNIKCNNIYIMGIPEGESEQGLRTYLKK